ncbi:MAG: serine hydrolase [Opitutales bacterium]
MKSLKFALIYASSLVISSAQASDNPLVLLEELQTPALSKVLENPAKYQAQIIYTQVNRDTAGGLLSLKAFQYNVDPTRYFYPASTVKLPAAILAVEFLNEVEGYKDLSLETEYTLSGPALERIYPNLDERTSSLSKDIEKIAVVSDNMAYNRLYDFLSPDYIEERIFELTSSRPRFSHRLAIFLPPELNRKTLAFNFASTPPFILEAKELGLRSYDPSQTIGLGYISRGELVNKPFSIHQRNFIPLETLHKTILGLVLGDEEPNLPQFKITPNQRADLIDTFSMLPRESNRISDTDQKLPDNYAKFLIYGDRPDVQIPDTLRIINKIGQAYGFLSDTAYVIDEASGVEFALSATIFVNENLIFNDNNYEYDTIGFPFLGELGRFILEFEKKRRD